MKFSRMTILRSALSTTAILAVLPAAAQTAPQDATQQQASPEDQEVVVTGSRIARRGTETASPIQVIDSKDLDARGYQTVAQALNELPAFGVPGASPVGFNQSSFGAGQSFVDFLGLGSQRTLTLVNGRRFVSGNTASIFGPTGSGGNQVDLNVIPTKLISRVETVAAIGAPIYGSDAIAGTINIILKKDYQGFDIDAQSGISSRGDASDYRIRALAGVNFAGGRGNITLSGEYNQSKGLLFTDRKVTSSDDRFDVAPSGSGPQVIYRDERIPSISPYGIPLVYDFINTAPGAQSIAYIGDPNLNVGVVNAAGQQLKFDQQGNLIPIDFGTVVGATADGSSIFSSGGNGFTLRDVENLLTDVRRYSANALVSFEVTPNLRVFGEGWYSVSQGRNLTNQPVYNSALFGGGGLRDGNLIVSINNPYLSSAARATIINSINTQPFSDQNLGAGPQDYFYLGRANVDLSSGVSTGRSEIIRFVGGVDGNVDVLPVGKWRFEAYFNYGRSRVTSRNPELNEQNFLNAINAVSSGGQIVCAPGYTNSPIPTVSSTCAPINPFGSQVSQAAKDYITTIATPKNLNNQYDGVVSVSGPLFKLPGGDFSFALGYEHRAEDSRFSPGTFYQGATTDQYPGVDFDGDGDPVDLYYGRSVPIQPVYGSYHTNELFGELTADLISPSNNIPFVSELSFQAAGRYIWNSQAGNDPTYTFQGRYAPIRDITFRAAYTRAVRAPSITEAFNPSSSAYGFATDVCDKSLRNSGPAPTTRAANCLAAGVPTTLTSQSNARSFPTFVIGNPTLQNEKSDNFTVGAVVAPHFLRGFTATVDYVDIKLNNAISQFSNSQVVAACYDAANFPNNPFCALVSRDFTGTPGTNTNYGQLNRVGTTYFNSSQLRYKGILAEISYRTSSDFLGAGSHLGFNLNYQYLDTLSTVVTAGSAPVNTGNSVGYSRHKGIGSVRYENGGFFGQVQVNYIGPARIDPDTTLNFYSVPKVKAFTYVNLSARYDIGKHFSLNADIDNVLDVKPPYPYPASGGTSPYFQGILGTYIRVGAAVHF